DSPRGSCGGLFCDFGTVAPGDSFAVVVVLLPLATGHLTWFSGSSSPVADPNPADNLAQLDIEVLPSAAQLLRDLVVQVQSFELKPGTEHVLVGRLRDARDAVAVQDTLGACRDLAQFRSHTNQQSGRGLTVAQAAELLQASDVVQGVLRCGVPRVAAAP